jgi:hypothetical protein
MNCKIKTMKYIKGVIACLMICTVLSCGKSYFQYEHFIDDGPIVYPGRADTVLALAGHNRIQLSWAVPSDLNITDYKVFWNFGADSLTVAGRKPGSADSVKLFIDNLQEGSYSFNVYTYDKDGHKSVATQTTGNVYGNIFSSTIYNRPIRSSVKDTKNFNLMVEWVGLDAKCIGTEWLYTDADGLAASSFSPIDDSTIILSCDVSKPVSYRSLFLPEPKAIDTFFTEFKNL